MCLISHCVVVCRLFQFRVPRFNSWRRCLSCWKIYRFHCSVRVRIYLPLKLQQKNKGPGGGGWGRGFRTVVRGPDVTVCKLNLHPHLVVWNACARELKVQRTGCGGEFGLSLLWCTTSFRIRVANISVQLIIIFIPQFIHPPFFGQYWDSISGTGRSYALFLSVHTCSGAWWIPRPVVSDVPSYRLKCPGSDAVCSPPSFKNAWRSTSLQ